MDGKENWRGLSFKAVEDEAGKGGNFGLEEWEDKEVKRVGDGIIVAESEEIAMEVALNIDGGSRKKWIIFGAALSKWISICVCIFYF